MDRVKPEHLKGISLTCPHGSLRLQTGEKVKIPIVIENGSTSEIDSLPPFPVYISYHWLDASGTFFIFNGERTPLVRRLSPGEVSTEKMFLESPKKEGKYSLIITLIQQESVWFEDISPGICASVPEVLVTRDQERQYAKLCLDALNEGNLEKANEYFRMDQAVLGNNISDKIPSICTVSSVKSWCRENDLPFHHLEGPSSRAITASRDSCLSDVPAILGEAFIPEAYIAEIHDAVITGGHTQVLIEKNVVLWDEYLHEEWDRFNFDQNEHIFTGNYRSALQCDFQKSWGEDIIEGILLSGPGSNNYYHWLVDYLSRFWAIDQFPEYRDFPLIIDEGLHPNLIEALRYCNKSNRAIIPVEYGKRYFVRRLVIPSNLSFVAKNVKKGEISKSTDVGISPRALFFLRNRFKVNERIRNSEGGKKIYVTRKTAHYRVLLNETEIENLFRRHGFQIVAPEKITFHEQLELFAGAEIIAGPHGAGMTNIIFAPQTVKLLFLCQKFPFDSLVSDILGQDTIVVSGPAITSDNIYEYQQNYVVPIEEVHKAIISFYSHAEDATGSHLRTNGLPAQPHILNKKSGITAFSVDRINGLDPPTYSHGIIISEDQEVIIVGWAIDYLSGTPADTVEIVFSNGQVFQTYYSLRRTDVARHFGNDALEYSGFLAIIPSNMIPVGEHKFSLKIIVNNRSGYYQPDNCYSLKIVR